MSKKGATPRRTPGNDSPGARGSSPARQQQPQSPVTPVHRTSATASDSGTPTRGPTPASHETSYHKRVRQLVVEHRRCRKEWNELVVRGLIARTRACIELWTDIENTIKHVHISKNLPPSSKSTVSAGYVLTQSSRLSEQVSVIETVLDSLANVVLTMTQCCDRAEYLVVEASKTRGAHFAFRDPLWVTWPPARFADGLQDLTTPYRDSLELVRALVDTLLTFPPLAMLDAGSDANIDTSDSSPSTSQKNLGHTSNAVRATTSTSQTDSAAPSDIQKQLGVRGPRPSSDTLQACMSLLAVQPLLPAKGTNASAEAWEEIMAVEIGGY